MSGRSRLSSTCRGMGPRSFSDLHDGVGRRVSGGDAGGDLEPGVAGDADQRRAACAAGVLRAAGGESGASKPARRVHQQSGIPVAADDSADGAGAMGAECGGVCDGGSAATATEWSHAMAQQLLTRYGVVFRETAHAEGLPGGFSAVYDVLKALEESRDACGAGTLRRTWGRRSLRCRRRWICCGRCGRSGRRQGGDGDAGGDGPGESVWGAAAVAGGARMRGRR